MIMDTVRYLPMEAPAVTLPCRKGPSTQRENLLKRSGLVGGNQPVPQGSCLLHRDLGRFADPIKPPSSHWSTSPKIWGEYEKSSIGLT